MKDLMTSITPVIIPQVQLFMPKTKVYVELEFLTRHPLRTEYFLKSSHIESHMATCLVISKMKLNWHQVVKKGFRQKRNCWLEMEDSHEEKLPSMVCANQRFGLVLDLWWLSSVLSLLFCFMLTVNFLFRLAKGKPLPSMTSLLVLALHYLV